MRRGFAIHHNGPPARCINRDHTRCVAFWAAVKNYHVNTRGWSDIAYSFGVCPHGTRFEGRGWNLSQWANGDDVVGPNNGRDREWYTVLAFIGQDATTHEAPTPEMVEGIRSLIAQGRNQGRCGLEVLPHNAFKVKPCPGPELTALANHWNGQDFMDLTPQEDDMPTIEELKAAGFMTFDQYKARSGELYNGLTSQLGRNYNAILGIKAGDDNVDAIADAIVEALTPELAAAVASRLQVTVK